MTIEIVELYLDTQSEDGDTEVIEIGLVGPPGADGAPGVDGADGEPGPQGDPGPAGGGSVPYIHNQSPASAFWTVNHSLGYFPNVTVVDSTGRRVHGTVVYVSNMALTIEFSAPFGGKAYLS